MKYYDSNLKVHSGAEQCRCSQPVDRPGGRLETHPGNCLSSISEPQSKVISPVGRVTTSQRQYSNKRFPVQISRRVACPRSSQQPCRTVGMVSKGEARTCSSAAGDRHVNAPHVVRCFSTPPAPAGVAKGTATTPAVAGLLDPGRYTLGVAAMGPGGAGLMGVTRESVCIGQGGRQDGSETIPCLKRRGMPPSRSGGAVSPVGRSCLPIARAATVVSSASSGARAEPTGAFPVRAASSGVGTCRPRATSPDVADCSADGTCVSGKSASGPSVASYVDGSLAAAAYLASTSGIPQGEAADRGHSPRGVSPRGSPHQIDRDARCTPSGCEWTTTPSAPRCLTRPMGVQSFSGVIGDTTPAVRIGNMEQETRISLYNPPLRSTQSLQHLPDIEQPSEPNSLRCSLKKHGNEWEAHLLWNAPVGGDEVVAYCVLCLFTRACAEDKWTVSVRETHGTETCLTVRSLPLGRCEFGVSPVGRSGPSAVIIASGGLVLDDELPCGVAPEMHAAVNRTTLSALSAAFAPLLASDMKESCAHLQSRSPSGITEAVDSTALDADVVVPVQAAREHAGLHSECVETASARERGAATDDAAEEARPPPPEPGDLVVLGPGAPSEHRGCHAVVTEVHESYCTVVVLDDTRSFGVGQCWPCFADVTQESRAWRLGSRHAVTGLRGGKLRRLNGFRGVITEHPREGHPSFVQKSSAPEQARLTLCLRFDDPASAGQRSVLLEPRFLKPEAQFIRGVTDNLTSLATDEFIPQMTDAPSH